MLKVDSTALVEVAKRIGSEYADQVKREAARTYSPVLIRALVEETPARTGNMRRRWKVEPQEDGGIRIRNATNYSMSIDRGSKEHDIPKTGTPGVDRPVLRWRTGGRAAVSSASAVARHASGKPGALAKGQFSFVGKIVKHPGTKAQHMVRHAFEKTGQQFAELINQGAERVIQTFIASSR